MASGNPGAVVKVIGILGNNTAKALEIGVR